MFTIHKEYKMINVFGQCKLTDRPKSTILKYITFNVCSTLYIIIMCTCVSLVTCKCIIIDRI